MKEETKGGEAGLTTRGWNPPSKKKEKKKAVISWEFSWIETCLNEETVWVNNFQATNLNSSISSLHLCFFLLEGYLAISLFLHEDHELILLLVNTIQRDLSSTNMLHNCMALSAVCKLIGSEMVPAVLPLVEEKLKHPKWVVVTQVMLAGAFLSFIHDAVIFLHFD